MANQRFCGHGFPDWASPIVQGAGKFPFPLPFHMKFDNNTGLPLNCGEHPFFEYYLSYACGNAFQNLYSNVNGTQDSFVKFWQHLANRFKRYKNVLGYELLNEPWVGDAVSHPSLLLKGGKADFENLQPMYHRLHSAIREEDDEHIIFYEPAVADIEAIGFTAGPSNSSLYNNRQALSYHIYCGFMDPKSRLFCNVYDDTTFHWRDQTVKKLGGGQFLTEFGFMSERPAALAELNWMLDESDKRFLSWTYWQFKFEYQDLSFYADNGTLLVDKVRTLARPHAQAICGTPLLTQFNVTSRVLVFEYRTGHCLENAPTVLFASKEFHYPNGVTISVEPTDALEITQVSDSVFHLVGKSVGQNVKVQLKPK